MPPESEPRHMSLNEVVAYNLFCARGEREWTQTQAAQRLERFLGKRWSKAVYSAAEWPSQRVRHFTVDDLYAFARAFERPITFFLLPPSQDKLYSHRDAPCEASTAEELLDLVFALDKDMRETLNENAVEMSSTGSAAIRQWAADYRALADERASREDIFIRAARRLAEERRRKTEQSSGEKGAD